MAPENRIEYFTHNINLFHLYFTHFPHPSRLVSLSTLATLYSNIIYGIVTWRRQYVFDSIFFLFLFIHFLFTFFPCLFSSLVIVLGSSSSSQANMISDQYNYYLVISKLFTLLRSFFFLFISNRKFFFPRFDFFLHLSLPLFHSFVVLVTPQPFARPHQVELGMARKSHFSNSILSA